MYGAGTTTPSSARTILGNLGEILSLTLCGRIRWSSSAASSSRIHSLYHRRSFCVNFANGELGRLRHARRRSNMEVSLEHPAEEIKRLQRCINDLVSLLALPAMWSGSKPCDIVHTLLDSLLRMLDLDFAYVSLTNLSLTNMVDAAASETVRVARGSQEHQSQEQMFRPRELCAFLNRWLGDNPQKPYLQ